MSLDAIIAARIRSLRAEAGLTLEALAARAGVSRAMLSRIERGQSSATAVLLNKVAAGLDVTLSALFAQTEAASPLSRAAAQPIWRDPQSGYLRRAVSPPGNGSAVDLVAVEMPPGARVAFDNAGLAGLAQHVWVLAGALELRLGADDLRLEAGDCLWMRLDRPVVFHNPTATPSRHAVIIEREGRRDGRDLRS
jgi:transcriptional regulator with XRE-family HTH domain